MYGSGIHVLYNGERSSTLKEEKEREILTLFILFIYCKEGLEDLKLMIQRELLSNDKCTETLKQDIYFKRHVWGMSPIFSRGGWCI